MSTVDAKLPVPRYIEIMPDVKWFLVRYFRLRNLLVDIMNNESVPQQVRDQVMVSIGARPQKVDLASLDKMYKISVDSGGS